MSDEWVILYMALMLFHCVNLQREDRASEDNIGANYWKKTKRCRMSSLVNITSLR